MFSPRHMIRHAVAVRGPFLLLLPMVMSFPANAIAQSSDTPSVWLRRVIIRGNEVTRPEVILREMGLRKGDPVTPEGREQDRERIYNLQIFNRVGMDQHVVGDSVDLYVSVDERWYFYPFPVLGIRHRDWNKWVYGVGVTHQNLGGWNQKLFAEAATGYDQWVTLNFRNPRFLGTDDYYFGLQTQYADLRPLSLDGSEYQQEVWLARVSLGKRFGYERTVVGTIGMESWRAPSGILRRTAAPEGRDVFLTASVQFVDDQRYLREYPMEGSFVSLEFTKLGFGESAMNLAVLRADLRRYIPVWDDWTVAVRGYTHLVTGGVVPSYRHVFFGYEERIRGEFAKKYEGEGVFGGNFELRMPVLDAQYLEADFIPVRQFKTLRFGLFAALWMDVGKIWYRNQSPFLAPLHGGYGAGLHAILPYGLVARLDAGFDRFGVPDVVFDAGASF